MTNVLILQNQDGNTIKQGDKSIIRYELIDYNNTLDNLEDKVAKIYLSNGINIVYKTEATVFKENKKYYVEFTIDDLLVVNTYYLEIIVDDNYIFPSDDMERLQVTSSVLGKEITKVVEKNLFKELIQYGIDNNLFNELTIDGSGVAGKDGKSIQIVEQTSDEFGNTIIEFNDGSQVSIPRGKEAAPLTIKDYSFDTNGNTTITFSDGNIVEIKKGKDGINGSDGLDGKDGLNGVDGVDGKDFTFDMFTPEQIESLKGEQGKQGIKGLNGVDGKSAYEIAVENGYGGDEVSWLSSLKGKNGVDGEDGRDGLQGIKGDKGEKGDTGLAGKDGSVVAINSSGYWTIDGVSTGIKAESDGAHTHVVSEITDYESDVTARLNKVKSDLKVLIDAKEVGVSQEELSSLETTLLDSISSLETKLNDTVQSNLNNAKGYTDNKIAALIDNAPETLNTLNELAIALGENKEMSSTLLEQVGQKMSRLEIESLLESKADKDHNHDTVYAKKVHTHTVKDITDLDSKLNNLKSTIETDYKNVDEELTNQLNEVKTKQSELESLHQNLEIVNQVETDNYIIVTFNDESQIKIPKAKDGLQGETGLTGETGAKGMDGRDGKDGAPFTYDMFTVEQLSALKGKNGLDGKSAYEIAKISGFDGSEQDWLASLKGERGLTGAKGEQGIQGVKGDKGDVGPKGDTGAIPNTDGWQKFKVTEDNGQTLYDAMLKVDFSDGNLLTNLPIGTRYIAASLNFPKEAGTGNGWLTKLGRSNNVIQYLEYRPYNSSKVFIKRFYKTWSDWEQISSGTNNNVSTAEHSRTTPTRFMGAMLQIDTNITMNPNTTYYIPWNYAVYNESGFWNPANPTRLVIPKGVKKVRVSANVLWSADDTGTKLVRIKKNGQYSLGLPYTLKTSSATSAGNATSGPVPVKEGDYFELEVRHTCDKPVDFRTDPYTWFSVDVLEFDDSPKSTQFALIGHRGASGYEDEHTIESYALAIEQGVSYIEMDLQLTKDKKLVCMHDSTIDRTTTGTGNVSDLTLAQIQSYKTKNKGRKIPSLEEVLNTFGDSTKYYIETKQPYQADMDAELLRVLSKNNVIGLSAPKGQVIIQSFSEESLKNIHNQYSDIPLVKLFTTITNNDVLNASQYAYGVGPNLTNTNKAIVDYAHNLGLVVHPWTANTKDEMNSMNSLGVDGFFTNYPDVFFQN